MQIPTSLKDLESILDDPRKAAEAIESGQMAAVVKAYSRATLKPNIEAAFREVAGEHGVNRPALDTPIGAGAARTASYSNRAPGVKMDDLGFDDIGDFVKTIWHRNPYPDARMADVKRVMDAYSSVEPSAGGFLIPETFRAEIAQTALEASIIRQRATVVPMTSGSLVMPFVDETTHASSLRGGLVMYWTEEGTEGTATEAKFGRVKLEPKKLMGLGAVPNELWADAPALSTWLMQALPEALAFYEDLAFLTGTGANEPLGILNADALVAVDAEDGQEADTIVLNNVLKMFSRMLPSSLRRAIWIANIDTFTELMTLALPVGVGGVALGLVNLAAEPFPTMLGRPLIYTEKVPKLGDQGDLCFVDPSYYLVGDRQAIEVKTSEHTYFTSDQTAIKPLERVDGRPWIQSAITPVNDATNTLSPFVTLAARA